MKTIKAKNGKSYTKKQICEAIEYWKKQLKKIDEHVIASRGIGFGGKINLQQALFHAMMLPSDFTLQVTYGKVSRPGLMPIDPDVVLPFDELNKNSDVAVEIITKQEYSDETYNMLETTLKNTLRQMFGVGFDVHADEYFMEPYKDKLGRTWYIAFLSFIG